MVLPVLFFSLYSTLFNFAFFSSLYSFILFIYSFFSICPSFFNIYSLPEMLFSLISGFIWKGLKNRRFIQPLPSSVNGNNCPQKPHPWRPRSLLCPKIHFHQQELLVCMRISVKLTKHHFPLTLYNWSLLPSL